MTRDHTPDDQPAPATAPDGETGRAGGADDPDDVEGHALPLVAGVSALGRAKAPAKRAASEPLPKLTKPFPSLRDDTKRG